MLGHFHSHEQSTVRAAHDAEAARGSNSTRHQILANGCKIVINTLTMCLESSLMPSGTKLAAAANVGQDEHTTALQPELADDGRIVWSIRDLEAAIGRQQSRIRTVVFDFLLPHNEVRNLRSVL